jgi:hypothetical protein
VGAWNRDGTILIGSVVGPLYSVQADDGAVKQATNLLAGQSSHRWPQFLPDGRFLLFTLGPPDFRGVYLGSTTDADLRRVSNRESGYRFMPPAHVLFARQGALWARRLSRDSTTLEGDLAPVAPKVLVSQGFFGYGAFSSSSTGSIAYRVILSPDGTRVVHQANGPRDGSVVYERRSDGTGEEIQLLEESVNEWHHPQDWSPDGRYIVYMVTTTTGLDLRVLPRSGERAPFDVARTSFAELNARFSPDSRWVAYESNETGRMEIYVQPFPGPGPKMQVSEGGGRLPRWRRDGSELFYVAADRRLMTASVSRRGSRLETGTPRALFTLSTTSAYEPSPDGKRFLVTAVVSEPAPSPSSSTGRPRQGERRHLPHDVFPNMRSAPPRTISKPVSRCSRPTTFGGRRSKSS